MPRSYGSTHPEPPEREPLTERFCEFPFERFETQSAGRVMFCCPAWLPAPFGNLRDGSPEASLELPAAQDIRRSILNGSFRYCSKPALPAPDGRRPAASACRN